MGTTWELRAATSAPRSIHYIEMDLVNKTTSEFRTVSYSPLGVPNSQVPLYIKGARLSVTRVGVNQHTLGAGRRYMTGQGGWY